MGVTACCRVGRRREQGGGRGWRYRSTDPRREQAQGVSMLRTFWPVRWSRGIRTPDTGWTV